MRIATRASALALAQAESVARRIDGAELVPMTTAGDRDRAAGDPKLLGQDKGRWVSELERALLAGEVDAAIHSSKDVPTQVAGGLTLVPVERLDARDALCGAPSLDALPEGARVGTSSLRREAQLRALRPDLDVAELRGNVDTRLRRLAEGDFDAIVIARAGLQRLGRTEEAGAALDELIPAAGQGTLVLELREGEPSPLAVDVAVLNAWNAERALIAALEADCDTPVGAHAQALDGPLVLRAFVGRPDGSAWVTDELTGSDPNDLGAEVARRLFAAGAAEVLGRT